MLLSTIAAVAFAFVRAASADPGVTPASFKQAADPGTSFNIDKVVSTFEIPPKPDVVLLVDITGSMSGAIANIKSNLKTIISTVTSAQHAAQFAVVSFGDLADGADRGFKVVVGLTSDPTRLQNAVDSLSAGGGGDTPEDWIYALYRVATDSIDFRSGSSPIVVLIGDATSHDPSPPSGGRTLAQAIGALLVRRIRVLGVNVGGGLNSDGKAGQVTSATGGSILPADASQVSDAIVSGLSNLDVRIVPSVESCSTGLSLNFDPLAVTIGSGKTTTFTETAVLAPDAPQTKTLRCTVRFLLNGAPGGEAFVQNVTVPVNQMGCFTCDPTSGKNKCHSTTSCTSTPFGTQCLTRPGFKADGAKDGDIKTQWRLKWPTGGHEHRVAVKPGTAANTLCDTANKGKDLCKEVKVAGCEVFGPPDAQFADVGDGDGQGKQVVLGDGELKK